MCVRANVLLVDSAQVTIWLNCL